MQELKFSTPVFHDGLNLTVRLGRKWSHTVIAETVVVVDSEGKKAGEAVINGVLYCNLGAIPSGLLAIEHDPSCRTPTGLSAELERVYGRPVRPHEMVSVLIFRMCRE